MAGIKGLTSTLVRDNGPRIDTVRYKTVEPEINQREASSYTHGTVSVEPYTDVEAKASDYAVATDVPKHETYFHSELRRLLNQNNKEQGSNTPDYILATFLSDMLTAFDKAVSTREGWYGRKVF